MSDRLLDHVQLLLQETRDELTKADSKASILLATAGVAASIVVGTTASANRILTERPGWAVVLWWLGISIGLIGIAAIASAIAPRAGHGEHRSAVRYFGHAALFSSPDELLQALRANEDQQLERAVDQLWVNSRLVVRKYRRIRFALASFGLAAILLIVVTAS